MQKQFILAQSLMQVDMGATETSLEENGLGKLVPDHSFKAGNVNLQSLHRH
jgi:hypothetical protein